MLNSYYKKNKVKLLNKKYPNYSFNVDRILLFMAIILATSLNAQRYNNWISLWNPDLDTKDLGLNGNILSMTLLNYETDPLIDALRERRTNYHFKNNKIESILYQRFDEVRGFEHLSGELYKIHTFYKGKPHSEKKFVTKNGKTQVDRKANSDSDFKLDYELTHDANGNTTKYNRLGENPDGWTATYTKIGDFYYPKSITNIHYTTGNKIDYQKESQFTYTKGNSRGEAVTIQQETETVTQDNKSFDEQDEKTTEITTITRHYNNKGDLIYEKRVYPKPGLTRGKIQEYETYYKYDHRGNWIVKIAYYTNNKKAAQYQERKITYADGLVSGNNVIDNKVIDATEIPEFKNAYSFRRDSVKNLFWLRDPSGKYLRIGDYTKLKATETNDAYFLDNNNGSLVQLVNYSSAKNNGYHKAKVISEAHTNYFFYTPNDNLRHTIYNGKIYYTSKENFLYIIGFPKGVRVIYNNKTKETYFTDKFVNGEVAPFKLLPKNKYNAYYFYKEVEGRPDFNLIENGKPILETDIKIIASDKYLLVEGENGYYKLTHDDRPFDKFYAPEFISKNDFETELSKTKYVNGNIYYLPDYISKHTNAKSSSTNSEQTRIPTEKTITETVTTNSNVERTKDKYNCNNNLNCLNQIGQGRYQAVIKKGKTEEVAAKAQAEVIEHVHSYNPKLAYEMVMSLKDEYVLKIIAQLSADARKSIREEAQKEVDAYTEKHGKPKIKTVPYKSKNN